MPSLSPTITSPNHWTYLSEGGATMVFSYSGPRDERFYQKVLRVRKDNDTIECEDNSTLFQTEIVSRLVPQKHLVDMEVVLLSPSWLKTLSSLCASSRPAWRTNKIDLKSTIGFLAPNLVSSPISIEIKPKWSFLRTGMRTCRFCMHSSCRGWTTSYCPLDLFSSSPARIRNACYALYDSWFNSSTTQNNFRLFVGGRLTRPHDLLPTLRRLDMRHSSDSNEKEVREVVVRTLHASLVQSESLSILKRLNELQRTLDGEGIEGLASLWNKVHSGKKTFGEGSLQPTVDEWGSFVNLFLERQCSSVSSDIRLDEESLRYNVLSYLLSTTFKDCSIMIMLPGLLHDSLPVSLVPPQITLIDLDPKPVQRLLKWLELDRSIVQEYSSHIKKECVDDWGIVQ